ncbi:MAG TPA: hypothetical protein ENJ29_02910 [Bacteroidetes bacterium]|nr:hypothetical protein [Bacteroidota bacterium]
MGHDKDVYEADMKGYSKLQLAVLHLVLTSALSGQSIIREIDSLNALSYNEVISNLEKKTELFRRNVARARAIGYKKGLAAAYHRLGITLVLRGQFDVGIEQFLNAIKLYEEMGDVESVAGLYGEFGYHYRRSSDLQKAKIYMRKGMLLAEKNELRATLAPIYDNYGVLKYIEGDVDSALYFYDKSLKIKYSLQDTTGIPYSLQKMANVFSERGDFTRALEYADKASEYWGRDKNSVGWANNLVLYAEIYMAMGETDKAIAYFLDSIKLARMLDYRSVTLYSYEQLSLLYERKRDYRNALINQKVFAAYKDSIMTADTGAKIAELELAYETEKKDRLLVENELKIRRRTILLIASAAVIILLVFLAWGIYRYQRMRSEKERQKLELSNRLKQAEMEKKMTDEKLRISRELHDNIGSHLTFIISSLDNLTYGSADDSNVQRLGRLSRFGRTTLRELRNTIWAMKQEEADLDRLILKINELKQQYRSEPGGLELNILSEVHQPVALSAVQMLNLYRIVQEALQNTVKYAGASMVEIRFEPSEDGFIMTIRDNGSGFDVQRTKAGNGLVNMRHRCREASGELEINSSEAGTEVRCRIVTN